jgi:hypothetical protein
MKKLLLLLLLLAAITAALGYSQNKITVGYTDTIHISRNDTVVKYHGEPHYLNNKDSLEILYNVLFKLEDCDETKVITRSSTMPVKADMTVRNFDTINYCYVADTSCVPPIARHLSSIPYSDLIDWTCIPIVVTHPNSIPYSDRMEWWCAPIIITNPSSHPYSDQMVWNCDDGTPTIARHPNTNPYKDH